MYGMACINVIITACYLRKLHAAHGKMHCRDKSARVEAKDALYFNPEMYTRFILCRVPRRHPIPRYPITNCSEEDFCTNKKIVRVKADNLLYEKILN